MVKLRAACHGSLWYWLPVAFAVAVSALAHAQGTTSGTNSMRATEVIVLSTLHQFHTKVPGYSFDELTHVIEALSPDVLAVELTASDLAARKPQATKQEYPRSVYGLLDRHAYAVVPLEPSEPEFTRNVTLLRNAAFEFHEKTPEQERAFDTYAEALFAYLFARWDSAQTVNSPETDALFAVKHRYQDAIFPKDQAVAWNAWNEHFAKVVLEAALRFPGSRIVVLVGVEHAYWLRDRLRKQSSVRLLDTPALLAQLPLARTR